MHSTGRAPAGTRESRPRARWRLPCLLALLGMGLSAAARAAEPGASGTACAKADVAKRRRSAEKLYREGRYAEAVEALSRTKASCWSALDTTDRGWLVSDLGLAALRAGQPELCRQVLAEAPAELDPQSRVAKALAHNRGLCQGDGSLAVQVFPGLRLSSPAEAQEALSREWSFSAGLREGRLPGRGEREIDRCTEADGVALEDLDVTAAIHLGPMQRWLLRCRALKLLTGARPSKVSHVQSLLSLKAPGGVLPADLAPAFSPAEYEAREQASREGRTWSVLDPKVRFEPDPARKEELRVRGNGVSGSLERWAVGDFNGDGFEDVLVLRGMSPDGGSATDLAAFLLTRTQPGGVLTLLERME